MTMAADDPNQLGDLLPRPDPTRLTTDQLRRELSALREILTARLDAMDRATVLLSETVNRTPTVIQVEITHVRELVDEKFAGVEQRFAGVEQRFAGVEQRFAERDVRSGQQNAANTAALDAALRAARELGDLQTKANTLAVAKTEESVAQQLKALTDKIDAITQRIDRGEGAGAGAAGYRTERRLDYGTILAAAAILVSLATVLVVAFKH